MALRGIIEYEKQLGNVDEPGATGMPIVVVGATPSSLYLIV